MIKNRILPICVCTAVIILSSCAQQGSLTGGLKDEKPPEVVSSQPPNFTTHFKSDNIIINFNEYFVLKEIAKQLVVSPPMTTKPDFKIKGKTLEITFKDTLLPDRTYAINFGDALQDLNEGNPKKNFQFVLSTGNTIDSLQTSGQVLMVPDSKPAEDVLVMLYSGNADSLPLKTMPLYVSRTDKEGKFTLRNLAAGSYKIFALKDGNSNLKFDQPTENVAFLDSLITPFVVPAPPDTVKPQLDSLNVKADSIKTTKNAIGIKTKKHGDGAKKDTITASQVAQDTLPVKPKFLYRPDNIELRLFTEVKPNQYIKGTDRLRRDQIRVIFNEKIDSLNFEFLDLPMDSVSVSLEWLGDPDTLDFWIMNTAIAARDSLSAILVYPALDSIEKPFAKTDTVKLKYRAIAKPAGAPKNDFTISVSVEKTKTLEYGQPLVFNTTIPYTKMDTSFIHLLSGKDSTARKVKYKMVPDSLKGLFLNGLPIVQVHPRMISLTAGFLADTSYHLTLLPGAFTGIAGQKNDTLDIRFKMKNKDQYGSAKITLPDLKVPGIIELVDARNKVAASKVMDGPGTAVFELIPPGKYTARLIFDTNRNGHWDTGRYLLHIQPERVIAFKKELNLKANWEVSETWGWKDL